MAINITQEPQAFYPAYNDCFLKFDTTFTLDDRAVIEIIDGTTVLYRFTIFPDNAGNYLFNLKEIVRAMVNTNQFKDGLDYSQAGWGFIDESLYTEITVAYTAYGDGSVATVEKVYSFNKAVKQFGDPLLTNPYQLMLPSQDGLNYALTYHEGFPLEIPFRYVQGSISTTVDNGDGTTTTTYSNEITIKNNRTQEIAGPFRPSKSAPYRLFIDKGLTNWDSTGVMAIPDMLNRMDILVDGVVQTSIDVTKKASEAGRLVKWMNADGSYSYWLFQRWTKQTHEGKEIDRIGTNNYSNVYGNNEGFTKITGKSGGSGLELNTIVTEDEKNHLISLVTSPNVELWSQECPYTDGKWLSVKVLTKGFTYSNKKSRNQIKVEIELPEINSQIL
ncbi:MAG: hypothetical protein WD625_00870 [Balneolales bacterium]